MEIRRTRIIAVERFRAYLNTSVSILPLVVFRVVLGIVLLISVARFIAKGWIDELYLTPNFQFKYYGFDWVTVPDAPYLYTLYAILILACVGIILGAFYRLSAVVFCLLFTYVELMDKTLYLNHYYFVSLLSGLLVFLPLHRNISVDAKYLGQRIYTRVPRWNIFVVQLLLAYVYFFAGVAKLESDWLFEALPLRIWLSSKSDLPIIGGWMSSTIFAYWVSWSGAIYDLSIAFLLWNNRTRIWAYSAVIFFHLLTWILFNIGMFPFIMIAASSIFFPASTFQRFKSLLLRQNSTYPKKSLKLQGLKFFLILFFAFQFLLPFRHLLYKGDVLWTEEGFRFSWRVMLVEKVGYVEYKLIHPESRQELRIYPSDHLSKLQTKQMSFQADMIWEFAHYLKKIYTQKWGLAPEIYADVWVSYNGHPSRRLIDERVDLAQIQWSLWGKDWIFKD